MLTHCVPHFCGVLGLHVKSHCPKVHVACPDPAVGPGHGEQRSPHVSTAVLLTQRPLQSWVPAGHSHTPRTQLIVPLHRFPQRPQLFLSERVSTHAPEHSVRSELHMKSHVPLSQTGVAPETLVRHGEHIVPHVATSSSLTHLPLQSCVPAAHSQRP
jgi:hypothetical protein